MRIIFPLIFCLLCLCSCKKPVQEYRERSVQLMKNEQFKEALPVLHEAIDHYKDKMLFYNLRGVCHFELQNYQAAIENYDKAIELDSSNYKPYYNRGNTYFALNNYPKARRDFERAIALQPDVADIYVNLANCQFQMQDFDAAIKNYMFATEIKQDHFLANLNLGKTLVKIDSTGLAITYLEEALRQQSEHGETYYLLALSKADQGARDEACILYHKSRDKGYDPQPNLLSEFCDM